MKLMDLDVFVTTSLDWQVPKNFFSSSRISNQQIQSTDSTILATWHENKLAFSSSQLNTRESSAVIPITTDMVNNVTGIFAHVYLSLSVDGNTEYTKKVAPLVKYKLRKKASTARSLLDDASPNERKVATDSHDDSVLGSAARKLDEDVILAYLKASLSLEIVDYHNPFPKGGIPKQFQEHMDFNNETGNYYPILYPSEFWLSSKDLIAINGTISNATIYFNTRSNSIWKWQLMSGMEKQWETQDALNGGHGESDLIRTVLLDTNPWLLAITGLGEFQRYMYSTQSISDFALF